MTGHSEQRSNWELLNTNHVDDLLSKHVRWRVGNLAESLHRMQDEGQGAQLADEADAFLRRLERQEAARTEGWRAGEPGE